MSQTYVEEQWLESHNCGECGILFAAPAEFWAQRHKDRKTWYCPNGHNRVFTGPSEADKLRAELERKAQMLEAAQAKATTAEAERLHVTKAHKKMRERVMNGVCPCCNRTFQNLMFHMRSEHPDFASVKTMFALRRAFAMTQADVAREAGVDVSHVSLYERDKHVAPYAKTRLDAWLDVHQARDAEASPVSVCAQQSVRPDDTPDDTTPAAQPAGRTGEHE